MEFRPDYELETFEDVDISSATTSIVKARHSQNDSFLLPLANHPWHRHNTHSFCVVVKLASGQQLVIPCMELIRFYFGSSSSLLSKLFLPPLERKALYRAASYHKPSGYLHLQLAEDIVAASAADIGRIHLNPMAWRAAARVGASMLKGSMGKQGIHPRTTFPFEGLTTLKASGKWLPSNDREQATFIVFHLRSCSHAFPFSRLRYETCGGRPQTPTTGQSSPDIGSTQQRRASADAPDQKLVEQDASNNLTPKTKQFLFEPRFPDLVKKPVWKSKQIMEDNAAPAFHVKRAPPINEAAVGTPGSEKRIRPIELAAIMAPEADQDRPPPTFLRNIVNELMQVVGIDIELLTRSDEDGWTTSIPIFADKHGVIDEQLFIEDHSGDARLRRAAVFALRREDEHASLVLIESSPVHMKMYATGGDDTEEVWRILSTAAIDFVHRKEPVVGSVADEILWLFDLDG